MPRALITGVTGQDGSYLAELLLGLGYEVHGTSRDPAAAAAHPNLASCAARLRLHAVELSDPDAFDRLLSGTAFDEVYHLAAQTHVARSYADPVGTCEQNVLSTVRLLEAVRHRSPGTRVFHAASSQVFGEADRSPQDESTPYRPTNPYGASKTMAAHMVRIARETHGLFAVNGICFNHESPRRGPEFVTGKICRAAAAIAGGRREPLFLGDISARRDWGDARSFVRGFHASLRVAKASDYVFATGVLHSVQDVIEIAFEAAGLDWREWVKHDPALLRPVEPAPAVGDPGRALRELGWTNGTPFRELIREMTRVALAAQPDGARQ